MQACTAATYAEDDLIVNQATSRAIEERARSDEVADAPPGARAEAMAEAAAAPTARLREIESPDRQIESPDRGLDGLPWSAETFLPRPVTSSL